MRGSIVRQRIDRALRRIQNGWASVCLAQGHTAATIVCTLLVVASLVVIVCSVIEDTITLPGDGIGLAKHYGIWAIFVSSPLLVALVSVARTKFISVLRSLDYYTVTKELPPDLEEKVKKHLESLTLHRKTRYALLLFIVVGFYWWLVNIYQTIHPDSYYGNDVFDAYQHILGFASFKLYLLIAWVGVYPVVGFVSVHIFISMAYILRYMSRKDLFRLDFFHEDGCGGVSVFGNINVILLAMTSLVFLTALAISLTHAGDYFSVWVAIWVSFLWLLAQSITGIYHIQHFVRRKKRDTLHLLNLSLNSSLSLISPNQKFPHDLLALRDHIVSIRNVPYTRSARVLMHFIRLSPAVLGISHIIQAP